MQAAWAAAGLELFSGVNVPSKAFGEFIEHASATPSIAADELEAWELTAFKDPRNWVRIARPAAGVVIGTGAAVGLVLPDRDGIDRKLFTACVERALEQSGVFSNHKLAE